jgi:hypothetical protein
MAVVDGTVSGELESSAQTAINVEPRPASMKRKSGAPDLLRAISVQVGLTAMDCIGCASAAATERSDRTAQGYRRFRCRNRGKQFNERSCCSINRVSLPSDIVAFVALFRLRCRLTLRDLSEIMLLHGFTVSHECIRQWEAKLGGQRGGCAASRFAIHRNAILCNKTLRQAVGPSSFRSAARVTWNFKSIIQINIRPVTNTRVA